MAVEANTSSSNLNATNTADTAIVGNSFPAAEKVSSVETAQGAVINLAIASNQDAVDMVEGFRNSFNNQTTSDRDEAKALRLNTRMHLYIMIGAFSGIANELLEPDNRPFLEAVLREHGLHLAKVGWNPYGPIATLLFGEWVSVDYVDSKGKAKKRDVPARATAVRVRDGKEEYFLPNRAAEKFAKVGRYAKSKGWEPSEIAGILSKTKGGMNAIVDCDTQANSKDVDETEADELVEILLSQPAHYTLDFSEAGLKPADVERKLVGLWAEVKDGEVLIRGVMPASETALEAHVRKFATANAAKLWKQKAQAGG